MRHDHARVAQLIDPEREDVGDAGVLVAPDAEIVLVSAEGGERSLPDEFVRLVRTVCEQVHAGRAVVLLSTDELRTFSEAAAILDLQPWLLLKWIEDGWLDDYIVGGEHLTVTDEPRFPLASIEALKAHLAEEYVDYTAMRLLGWDYESAQCTWTTALQVIEPGLLDDHVEEVIQAGSDVVLRYPRQDRPLGEPLRRVLLAVVRETAAGHSVVLASLDAFIDQREAMFMLASSIGRIVELIRSGALDDYYFDGELHLPAASVEARYRFLQKVARETREELEAESDQSANEPG